MYAPLPYMRTWLCHFFNIYNFRNIQDKNWKKSIALYVKNVCQANSSENIMTEKEKNHTNIGKELPVELYLICNCSGERIVIVPDRKIWKILLHILK